MAIEERVSRSIEVRWFGSGAASPALTDWFRGLADGHGVAIDEQDPRVDRYLVLSGCDGLGVKHREGKLEVKTLRNSVGEHALGGALAGEFEAWTKWGAKGESAAAFLGSIASDSAHWVECSKARHGIPFALDGDALRGRTDGGWVDAGCNLELTRIEVLGRPYWSFAAEMFGGDALTEDPARLVEPLRALLPEDLPGELVDARSDGYPRWLGRLSEAGQA